MKYKTSEDYMLREIAGEAVLVPVGENASLQNAMITLNETAAFLWKLFEEPRTIEEAVNEILKEYEGSAEQIQIETAAFAIQGVEKGTIEAIPE